ncbi:hypothetical protein ACS0TY_005471 [Phlomoides rotata]
MVGLDHGRNPTFVIAGECGQDGLIGAFIKMDNPTANRERFDVARVLLFVPYLNETSVFSIFVNIGHIFKIKVVEEFSNSSDGISQSVRDIDDQEDSSFFF